jgi:hypothetical protein
VSNCSNNIITKNEIIILLKDIENERVELRASTKTPSSL